MENTWLAKDREFVVTGARLDAVAIGLLYGLGPTKWHTGPTWRVINRTLEVFGLQSWTLFGLAISGFALMSFFDATRKAGHIGVAAVYLLLAVGFALAIPGSSSGGVGNMTHLFFIASIHVNIVYRNSRRAVIKKRSQ